MLEFFSYMLAEQRRDYLLVLSRTNFEFEKSKYKNIPFFYRESYNNDIVITFIDHKSVTPSEWVSEWLADL